MKNNPIPYTTMKTGDTKNAMNGCGIYKKKYHAAETTDNQHACLNSSLQIAFTSKRRSRIPNNAASNPNPDITKNALPNVDIFMMVKLYHICEIFAILRRTCSFQALLLDII